MSKDKGKFDNVILFPENKIKKQPTAVDPKAQKKMRDYQTTKFVETACDKIGLDMIKEFAQMQLSLIHISEPTRPERIAFGGVGV